MNKQELHENCTCYWNSVGITEQRRYKNKPLLFVDRYLANLHRGEGFMGLKTSWSERQTKWSERQTK